MIPNHPLGRHNFDESRALAEYNEGFLRPQQHSSLDASDSPDVPVIPANLTLSCARLLCIQCVTSILALSSPILSESRGSALVSDLLRSRLKIISSAAGMRHG